MDDSTCSRQNRNSNNECNNVNIGTNSILSESGSDENCYHQTRIQQTPNEPNFGSNINDSNNNQDDSSSDVNLSNTNIMNDDDDDDNIATNNLNNVAKNLSTNIDVLDGDTDPTLRNTSIKEDHSYPSKVIDIDNYSEWSDYIDSNDETDDVQEDPVRSESQNDNSNDDDDDDDEDEEEIEFRNINIADPLFSSVRTSSSVSTETETDDHSQIPSYVSIPPSQLLRHSNSNNNNFRIELSNTTRTSNNDINQDAVPVATSLPSEAATTPPPPTTTIRSSFIHRLVRSIFTNSDVTNNTTTTTTADRGGPINRQYVQTVLQSTIRCVKFIVLCPIVFVLNLLLILILIIYISCLFLAACFCPTCLERVLTSEHTYTTKQIQSNLLRRECLEIMNPLHSINDIEQQQSRSASKTLDKLCTDKYEIITAKKKLIFSKPLHPNQAKATHRRFRRRREKLLPTTNVASIPVANNQESLREPTTGIEQHSNKNNNCSSTSPSDVESGDHPLVKEDEKTEDCEKVDVKTDDQNEDEMYDNGEGCDICMGCYKVGDVITWSRNPACGHMFHESCITEWLCGTQRKLTCPCCRSEYVYELDKRRKQKRNFWERMVSSASLNVESTTHDTTAAPSSTSPPTDIDIQISIPTINTEVPVGNVHSDTDVIERNQQDTTGVLASVSSTPNMSGILLSSSWSNASDGDSGYDDDAQGSTCSHDQEVVFSNSNTFADV